MEFLHRRSADFVISRKIWVCLQDIDVNELACSVRTGKILGEFFFCKFSYGPSRRATEARSINLQKKERDQYFPSTDRTG